MGRVVVIGSLNTDLVTRVERLPRPGETVLGSDFTTHLGGKGANQALAAARLGADTHLIGLVGDDERGERCLQELVAGGVDVAAVGCDAAPTGVAQILVDADGENLIAVSPGANANVTEDHVVRHLAALAAPDAVLVASLEIPVATVAAAAVATGQQGTTVVVNPAPAHVLPGELVAACDVLVPNEHEADALGWSGPEELLAAGAAAVLVTQGARGATLHRLGAEPVHQPAFPADVVDTTGAGDAFVGALAVALSEGATVEEAGRFAAAAGACAVSAAGAQAGFPTRDGVIAVLRGTATVGTGTRGGPSPLTGLTEGSVP